MSHFSSSLHDMGEKRGKLSCNNHIKINISNPSSKAQPPERCNIYIYIDLYFYFWLCVGCLCSDIQNSPTKLNGTDSSFQDT